MQTTELFADAYFIASVLYLLGIHKEGLIPRTMNLILSSILR